MGTKRKVCEVVLECLLELKIVSTTMHLNVLLLGSYNVLIDMDWLEQHRAKVDYFNKLVKCIDGKGMPT